MQLTFRLTVLACLLVTALSSSELAAQEQVGRMSVGLSDGAARVVDLPRADLHAVSLTWSRAAAPRLARVRYSLRRGHWSEWTTWPLGGDAGPRASRPLFFPGEAVKAEVELNGGRQVKLRLTSYATAETASRSPRALAAVELPSCDCPPVAVVGRSGWCPEGDCEASGTPTPVTPRHLVVHHSGTALPTTDYASVVRAIRDHHVFNNGWDDIGYNYLVAPDGTVYEGRGAERQGAHFCGANSGTLGVCVLGDYTDADLPAAALASLVDLASYLGCGFSIDPLTTRRHAPSGRDLAGLVGHRDGCATECPGGSLYRLLPTLQAAVAGQIDRACAALASPTGLRVSPLAAGEVALEWDRYAQADQVVVERSTGDPTAFEVVGSVDGDRRTFTDAGVGPGTHYYRIRVLADGRLSPYSEEVLLAISSIRSPSGDEIRPRLARNPVTGRLEVLGVHARIEQALIKDPAGRTVLRLPGGTTSWDLNYSALRRGRYFVVVFSGYEWYTLPFDYQP